MEIMELFFTPDEKLYDRPITDFFDDEVLSSNFWLYWRTMFAFENWHTALEMKLYIKRYIHHIAGLPDFSALRFTRYNQYESMILPLIEYLKAAGVQFHFNTKVEDIRFSIGGGAGPGAPAHRHRPGHHPAHPAGGLPAQPLQLAREEGGDAHRAEPDRRERRSRTRRDHGHRPHRKRPRVHHQRRLRRKLHHGRQDKPAAWKPELAPGGGWDMWRRIAEQDPSFGHPDTFCGDPEKTNWMSATVTPSTARSSAISRRSASATPSPATWSPAAS